MQNAGELMNVASGSGDVRSDNIFGDHHAPPPPLEEQRIKEEKIIASKQDTVRIVTGFECSTPLEIEKISPTHFAVRIATDSTLKNWFMFRVEGAKGKTVRIDIRDAPIQKWWSLNPVYSHTTELDSLSAFEAKPVNKAITYTAYNGPTLPDTTNQQWHFIPNVWIELQKNGGQFQGSYCFVHKYDEDFSYIGMRVPYTPSYNKHLLDSLKYNSLGKLLKVGTSNQGQDLEIFQIGEPSNNPKHKKKCLLIYSREHGAEQDCSWVAIGAIHFFISEDPSAIELRTNYTLLVIPILDVDSAAASRHEGMINAFYPNSTSVEASSYAAFFRDWSEHYGPIDIAIDLHSVESAESTMLSCPVMDLRQRYYTASYHFNELLDSLITTAGYSCTSEPWAIDTQPQRLVGWLADHYGTVPLPYEVNAQEQHKHLNINELQTMGKYLLEACDAFCKSPANVQVQLRISKMQSLRSSVLQKYPKLGNESDALIYEAKIGQVSEMISPSNSPQFQDH